MDLTIETRVGVAARLPRGPLRSVLLVCWLAALSTGPGARAAVVAPPTLDTAALCAATTGEAVSSPRFGDCVAAEDRAFRYLQGAYPAVPARVRERCERLSRRGSEGHGSYAFIQGCLDLK